MGRFIFRDWKLWVSIFGSFILICHFWILQRSYYLLLGDQQCIDCTKQAQWHNSVGHQLWLYTVGKVFVVKECADFFLRHLEIWTVFHRTKYYLLPHSNLPNISNMTSAITVSVKQFTTFKNWFVLIVLAVVLKDGVSLHLYRLQTTHKLLAVNRLWKQVVYEIFINRLNNVTYEWWVHVSGYANSQNMRVWSSGWLSTLVYRDSVVSLENW